MDRKQHWEAIYSTKQLNEVSWYQSVPKTSLNLIKEGGMPLSASIIDVGGGDSLLVDHLLDLGYTDITVLDISCEALKRAQTRLGARATLVKWIEADITEFHTEKKYDLWHDRAVFHFLTEQSDSEAYLEVVQKHTNLGAAVIMGTFSETGPLKCSGIPIRQYSENSLSDRLKKYFDKIRCFESAHTTPFQTVQNFLFCIFKKPLDRI